MTTTEKKIELNFRNGKPVLDVTLSEIEKTRIGVIQGNNIETLGKLGSEIPDILTAKSRTRLQNKFYYIRSCSTEIGKSENLTGTGMSLSVLMQLASGITRIRGRKAGSNAGSHITVVVKDEAGQVLHEGSPQEHEKVRELRQQVVEIKEALKGRKKLGVSQKTIDDLSTRLDAAVESYARVFDLAQKGLWYDKIAAKTGLSHTQVTSWLDGAKKPKIIDSYRVERLKSLKPAAMPREYSPEFAYILGAYAASKKPHVATKRLKFNTQEKEVMDRLKKSVEKILGREVNYHTKDLKEGKGYEMIVSSKDLTGYVNELTEVNSKIPWEHLLAKQERISFIQGFLDFSGGIEEYEKTTEKHGDKTDYAIRVEKSGNEDLLKELTILFETLDILPRIQASSRLVIGGQHNLDTFLGHGGFTSKALNKKLSTHKTIPEKHTAMDYLKYWRYTRTHPSASQQEIRKATGIPLAAVKDFMGGLHRPRLGRNLEQIEEHMREQPNPLTIGYLHRTYRVDRHHARIISKKQSIRDVVRNELFLKDQGYDKNTIRNRPTLLSLNEGELINLCFKDGGVVKSPSDYYKRADKRLQRLNVAC